MVTKIHSALHVSQFWLQLTVVAIGDKKKGHVIVQLNKKGN